jgi:hypothetical protein
VRHGAARPSSWKKDTEGGTNILMGCGHTFMPPHLFIGQNMDFTSPHPGQMGKRQPIRAGWSDTVLLCMLRLHANDLKRLGEGFETPDIVQD